MSRSYRAPIVGRCCAPSDLRVLELTTADPMQFGKVSNDRVSGRRLHSHSVPASGLRARCRTPSQVRSGGHPSNSCKTAIDGCPAFRTVICSLGSLLAGTSATVTTTATPLAPGAVLRHGSAFSGSAVSFDPNIANNTASSSASCL